MTAWIHDYLAVMSRQANDQAQNQEFNLIGHVIEYDVNTNMCRVLLPTRRAENDDSSSGDSSSGGSSDSGQTMETGWIQVGVPAVGKGWGFQYCLKGGATADNPEQGEQVQVTIQDRFSGLCAVANLTFNDEMPPPGAGQSDDSSGSGSSSSNDVSSGGSGGSSDADPATDADGSQQLQPAECIVFKHESGAIYKFYEDGSIRVNSRGTLYLQVKQDINIVIEEGNLIADVQKGDVKATVDMGNVSLDVAKGSISVTADTSDIKMAATKGNFNISCGKDFSVMAGGLVKLIEGVPPAPAGGATP
jgi:hypothetical protein